MQAIPNIFADKVDIFCEENLSPEIKDYFLAQPEHFAEFRRVCACSDYVADIAAQSPALFLELLQSNDIYKTYSAQDMGERVNQITDNVTTIDHLYHALRICRKRESCRIAWRDLCNLADLNETITNLSNLADALIDATNDFLYQHLCEQYGTPYNSYHHQQHLIILAVGKLGSQELNFSSDIDLIFIYPDKGKTHGAETSITNEEFFTRLAQQFGKAMQTITEDGYVFRVDLRLRPFGDSGPIVVNLASLSAYYQEQGRDWERYALLKGRPITGRENSLKKLLSLLKPFVYRRYIDYGSIDALRTMKQLIQREVNTKGLEQDIKRGAGGIRQIEFIGQVFQLIRGGKDRRLQQRKILPVLRYLKTSKTLTEQTVDDLSTAYVFLRNLEHRLQMVADKQTHMLPSDETEQARIAFAMNFPSWDSFLEVLNTHRNNVESHFEQMLLKPKHEEPTSGDFCRIDVYGLWMDEIENDKALRILHSIGFSQTQKAYDMLKEFHDSYRCRNLDEQSKERLNTLMPILLQLIGKTRNPNRTLRLIINLLDGIVRRSVYLALLLENPNAINWLIRLFTHSNWMADKIKRYPLLLEELISVKPLTSPATEATLEDELRQSLLSIPEDDLEGQMEVLRSFKLRQFFRVAASDIEETMPLMKVSDHLTFTATTILRQVQEIALKVVRNKVSNDEQAIEKIFNLNFVIIAYGKLGGIELSYASDLDLVFLHNNPPGYEEATFRLAKRVIHMLSTRMTNGILYKVDTRLRPSGSAGLMVSSLDAFAEYQQNAAWTWEHQALVRARVITGPAEVAEKFQQIRHHILSQPRDHQVLKNEVNDMRVKMQESNEMKKEGFFDVKQGRGGIADIEFIVQYGVLAWSHEHPECTTWTDNIRILETFADAGLMPADDVLFLIRAYKDYRALAHRHALNEEEALIPLEELQEYRDHVIKLWERYLS